MLRIKDAGFADAMRGYFERELRDCQWITPELHRRRASLWQRIKWGLSHFLVNVMDYGVTRRLNFRSLKPSGRLYKPRTESRAER
jgi:cardiolipin synthase